MKHSSIYAQVKIPISSCFNKDLGIYTYISYKNKNFTNLSCPKVQNCGSYHGNVEAVKRVCSYISTIELLIVHLLSFTLNQPIGY